MSRINQEVMIRFCVSIHPLYCLSLFGSLHEKEKKKSLSSFTYSIKRRRGCTTLILTSRLDSFTINRRIHESLASHGVPEKMKCLVINLCLSSRLVISFIPFISNLIC